MKIFITNKLTDSIKNQVHELINHCKDVDNLNGCVFMDEDMNIYPEFPCYIYCIEQDRLISFLSIFVPSEDSCEIYAYVHPAYRNKHIFSDMYNTAKDIIIKHNISYVQIVCEPNSPGENLLFAKGATEYVCECMMKYNTNHTLKIYDDYKIIPAPDNDYFELKHNNITLGHCSVNYTITSATIYNVEILEPHQGKGYSKILINMVIPHIKKSSIVLHVTASNIKALRAYTSCGFDIIEELHFYNIIL